MPDAHPARAAAGHRAVVAAITSAAVAVVVGFGFPGHDGLLVTLLVAGGLAVAGGSTFGRLLRRRWLCSSVTALTLPLTSAVAVAAAIDSDTDLIGSLLRRPGTTTLRFGGSLLARLIVLAGGALLADGAADHLTGGAARRSRRGINRGSALGLRISAAALLVDAALWVPEGGRPGWLRPLLIDAGDPLRLLLLVPLALGAVSDRLTRSS